MTRAESHPITLNWLDRCRFTSSASTAVFLAIFVACGPSQSGTSQGCQYTTSGNWPFGGTFNPGNPASCPISTPPGGRDQSYLATASIPSAASAGTGTLTFLDNNGGGVSQEASVGFAGGYNGTYDLYTFSGRYTAGRITPSGGSSGNDTALNHIALTGGGIATANATLSYQTSVAAAVLGLSYVDPGYSTTLSGEYYQSDLLPPISYQWYKDWSPISGEIGTTLEAFGGAPNSVSNYEFRVTDSQGRIVSASINLATSAGCGTQLEC